MKKFENITTEEVFGAIVNFGADPYLVETEEQALEVVESINNASMRMVTDQYEYETVKKQLDLDGHNTGDIYSGVDGSEFVICFAEDWD